MPSIVVTFSERHEPAGTRHRVEIWIEGRRYASDDVPTRAEAMKHVARVAKLLGLASGEGV